MSKEFSSLSGFATFMTGAVAEAEHAAHSALEHAAVVVEKEAKRVLGTYDYNWPQLAESTQEQRLAQGYSENEPGLRSGAMRDSIEYTVGHNEAQVGSNDKHLVYFELGTSKQQPRSVLMQAALHKEKEVHALIGGAVHMKLIGG